ncbi:hypothetical protein FB470_003380 [Amycolatopsis thermophila]|uniref:Uncharacterized protein n=1 Tax=Amycolatopsis thermophila TaxID=206084 RepID=A0ABU0EWM9_9PSEU|nr:hypothetical protein [Amycolatopsis thermophila]
MRTPEFTISSRIQGQSSPSSLSLLTPGLDAQSGRDDLAVHDRRAHGTGFPAGLFPKRDE